LLGLSWAWNALLPAAVAPVLAGAAGGIIGALSAGGRRSATAGMISFAAGAFLVLACSHMIPEAAEQVGWPGALLAAVLGCLASSWLARHTGAFCPACTLTHPEDHLPTDPPDPGDVGLGLPVLIVVALHSLLDGLALTASHGHHSEELLAAVLLVHKLPEGMVVAAVLRTQGRSLPAAIGLTAVVEAMMLLGVPLGSVVGIAGHAGLGAMMGAVGGSFLYLGGLTLSSSLRSAKGGQNALAATAGALLLLLAQFAFR
jgi:ZIP family zinc transporter